jgi:hypothetical protein
MVPLPRCVLIRGKSVQNAIDRIMQTYGLLVNITAAEEQVARQKVTSHLGGRSETDEHKLTVEGLRYLRALQH